MASEGSHHFFIRALVKSALNIALVWSLATYLDQYFQLTGGWPAIIIVGLLLMVFNIVVRPILNLITLPLKLFATMLAVIVVNGAFIQFIYMIILQMDPTLVQLEIFGGVWGWVVVATVLGFGNWVMKIILK